MNTVARGSGDPHDARLPVARGTADRDRVPATPGQTITGHAASDDKPGAGPRGPTLAVVAVSPVLLN